MKGLHLFFLPLSLIINVTGEISDAVCEKK
jgi:hypothetical protein